MIIKKLQRTVGGIRSIPKTAHKPYLVIFFDLLVWVITNRGEINVYFHYKLYLKGKRAADYVKTYQFKRIEKEINSPEYYSILEDKYFFSQLIERQGIRSPRNLFLLDQYGILEMGSKKYISGEELLQNDFDGFCKLINGYGGKMIFQLEVNNNKLYCDKEVISVSDFMQFLGKKKFLIQERIRQHHEMDALNPSCINTLRMLTIRNGKDIQYYQSYLRIGINNSIVDNGAKGNIMIGIDMESGRLMEFSDSMDNKPGVAGMDRHPQTRTVFKGFNIPFYQESVEMVKSLHLLFQQFFMIGWDIGITPEGPIVIEGNNITTLQPFQVFSGGLKSSFYSLANEYRDSLKNGL